MTSQQHGSSSRLRPRNSACRTDNANWRKTCPRVCSRTLSACSRPLYPPRRLRRPCSVPYPRRKSLPRTSRSPTVSSPPTSTRTAIRTSSSPSTRGVSASGFSGTKTTAIARPRSRHTRSSRARQTIASPLPSTSMATATSTSSRHGATRVRSSGTATTRVLAIHRRLLGSSLHPG